MSGRGDARRRGAGAGISIGAAAVELGVHPQTLRDYERLGLIEPARTPGGTRRYGSSELGTVRRVRELAAAGMNLTGVRRVIELETELRRAHARIEQLQHELAGRGRSTPGSSTSRPGVALEHRSISVELVHVPRQPRSPRWRNRD